MLPADLEGLTPPPAGAPAFFLGPNEALTNITNSYRVAVTWDPAPTIALTRSEILGGIGNAACPSPAVQRACVPQPPPATPVDYLDNLSGRYMHRLIYRNQGTQAAPDESLVVSATSTGSAGPPAHGAVEWFEFRHDGNPTTHPTLFQNATFDPDINYRWMPSIAMDKDRNILLGYSKSSLTVKPGIYLTGRLATDTINTMGAEIEMQPSTGVQHRRWESLGRLHRHDPRPDRPVHLLLYERVLKDGRSLPLVHPDRQLQVPILRLGRGLVWHSHRHDHFG